ncbi:MAG: hypothetical protein US57_C0011G0108 [Candidatus Moranbacteria bacterium GW2011_GWC2_37_73]|nr:MAG: hypothetical protein UR95_C0006G0072 [Parcubacteria group bacterium GW2011_GWC1_36_108]KKQ00463.1 MAG: hypothetical protein US09_C0011G0021 [Candidatus Moranbacteria bacterium GW2011_GWD1_36_198]KKQ01695.1 MAG: hypothetical protein US10_C0009G0014 [Candidatus Moranbacteria bacterium GW2011_GWD2_36_198]KKQ39620.1 MAG: hypothetical protein US57_C0011G0108 [Candidatus Moranbacteria bacterium GW2011_GWC2_37_73]HAR99949.1 Holliday junction resolvase RuvX [Candidatus Moranbacteria bacterium]
MNKSIDQSDMAEVSHILGVDFGKSKIGLAIADSETKMAFAYDTIKNDGEFLQKLKEIIKKEDIKMIVLGMTKHTNDKQSEQEKMDFAKKIEKESGISVMFQEEMFTTKMAQANIKMRGGRDIAKTDDQEAARIILQSWLDTN